MCRCWMERDLPIKNVASVLFDVNYARLRDNANFHQYEYLLQKI